MNLVLTPHIVSKLTAALERAGKREIGGVIMAEHVDENVFRVVDVTVQMRGGTFAGFVRLVEDIVGPLRAFFRATKHHYTRYNYAGEWHSHHSFALVPSPVDHSTMREIVVDPTVGARFAVLLLVRLNSMGQLEHSVTVYTPSMKPTAGQVMVETSPDPMI